MLSLAIIIGVVLVISTAVSVYRFFNGYDSWYRITLSAICSIAMFAMSVTVIYYNFL